MQLLLDKRKTILYFSVGILNIFATNLQEFVTFIRIRNVMLSYLWDNISVTAEKTVVNLNMLDKKTWLCLEEHKQPTRI